MALNQSKAQQTSALLQSPKSASTVLTKMMRARRPAFASKRPASNDTLDADGNADRLFNHMRPSIARQRWCQPTLKPSWRDAIITSSVSLGHVSYTKAMMKTHGAAVFLKIAMRPNCPKTVASILRAELASSPYPQSVSSYIKESK